MRISTVSTALGERKIDLKSLHNDFKRLIDKTGIRFVFETQKTIHQLAETAALTALNINHSKIHVLILVTQSPEYFLPSNAIILANKLNLSNDLLAFDVNQGCSGFVQALSIAYSLSLEKRNILIVTADTYRHKLKPDDRSTNAVFSDGAAATIIEHSSNYSIIYENHMTFGEYKKYLYQHVSDLHNEGYLYMAGGDVWLFTLRKVVPQIKKAIEFCELNHLNINSIYIHQASKLVVEGIIGKLEKYSHLFYTNYNKFGNTVSSSIPFLLKDYPVEHNQGVSIFVGFGVGLTSSIVVLGNK